MDKLENYKKGMKNQVISKANKLDKIGWKEYLCIVEFLLLVIILGAHHTWNFNGCSVFFCDINSLF
jgi:hypothetical protein